MQSKNPRWLWWRLVHTPECHQPLYDNITRAFRLCTTTDRSATKTNKFEHRGVFIDDLGTSLFSRICSLKRVDASVTLETSVGYATLLFVNWKADMPANVLHAIAKICGAAASRGLTPHNAVCGLYELFFPALLCPFDALNRVAAADLSANRALLSDTILAHAAAWCESSLWEEVLQWMQCVYHFMLTYEPLFPERGGEESPKGSLLMPLAVHQHNQNPQTHSATEQPQQRQVSLGCVGTRKPLESRIENPAAGIGRRSPTSLHRDVGDEDRIRYLDSSIVSTISGHKQQQEQHQKQQQHQPKVPQPPPPGTPTSTSFTVSTHRRSNNKKSTGGHTSLVEYTSKKFRGPAAAPTGVVNSSFGYRARRPTTHLSWVLPSVPLRPLVPQPTPQTARERAAPRRELPPPPPDSARFGSVRSRYRCYAAPTHGDGLTLERILLHREGSLVEGALPADVMTRSAPTRSDVAAFVFGSCFPPSNANGPDISHTEKMNSTIHYVARRNIRPDELDITYHPQYNNSNRDGDRRDNSGDDGIVSSIPASPNSTAMEKDADDYAVTMAPDAARPHLQMSVIDM